MSPRGGGGGSSRPIPGKAYVTHDGETLEEVGIAATGTTGGALPIYVANSGKVNPAVSKLPKGTKLVIPGGTAPPKVTGKAPYDLTCIIGGREVPLMTAKIVLAMDTVSDGWTGSIAWTPGADPKLDEATRPFGYTKAAIYIGNTLMVNGRLYGTAPSLTHRGQTKELAGYSYTIDAVDSSVVPPYQTTGIGIRELAKYYCDAMGIKVILHPSVRDKAFLAPFKPATAHEGERIFDHLAKLASQRGALVSCTPEGDMLFLRAAEGGKPVATLQEGDPLVTEWKAHYDGRKRWHAYKIITAAPVKGKQAVLPIYAVATAGKQLPSTITEFDDSVPLSRFQTFRADDVTPGNIHHASRWKRNKCFADAMTIQLPVSDWYAPNGKVWEPNTTVIVKSATLGVPKGFEFLIRSVEFELREKERGATLNIVPPQVFTGKDLEAVWG